MADQKTVVAGNGRSERPSKAMRRGMSGFAHDLSTLVELQIKLLVTDLQECVNRVIWPGIAVVLGLVLLLGSLPVLLAAIALLIVQAEWLSAGWAFLVISGAAILISAISAYAGYLRLRRSFTTLQRSKDELLENLQWLKRVLKHQAETEHSATAERY